jgi:hypothetical protein
MPLTQVHDRTQTGSSGAVFAEAIQPGISENGPVTRTPGDLTREVNRLIACHYLRSRSGRSQDGMLNRQNGRDFLDAGSLHVSHIQVEVDFVELKPT